MKFLSKFKHSILMKYILSFIVPIAIISISFSTILYFFSQSIVNNQVLDQFEKNLELLVQEAQREIDPSVVEEADNGDKEKYQELLNTLNNYAEKYESVELAYVLTQKGDKSYIVGVNGDDLYGTEYALTKEMNNTFNKGTTEISDIYEDEYGIHKSISAPIEGTEMMVGIDLDASFIQKLYSTILMISIILSLIFIIIGVIVAFFVSKKIINPLLLLRNYVSRVANGDLSVNELHVKGKDEIAQLAEGIQTMVQNLNELIASISESGEQVAATSQELMAGAEQTSQSINQITGAIQEVSSGVENQVTNIENMNDNVTNISGSMQQITDNLSLVTDNSQNTTNIAENGSKVIEEAVEKVHITYKTIQETSEVVNRLSDYTKEISDIVTIITEITDQTNLLALNASIEAARAGEHGKGFAVVAEEVRKLADQSKEAANHIRSKIEVIKDEATNAVKYMAAGSDTLKDSVSSFEHVGADFSHILESVNSVNNQILEINHEIAEMNKGVQHISSSMNDLSSISTQTSGNIQNVAASSEEQSATMEEITSSANVLSQMAENLNGAVKRFKL
ncbi:methyl-accepting chemotaxis protein [Lysinibacillus sp. SGAir0095]|uniref:methyl-accepting chemotaxis protein n=1 Tax=Lysinibacillus sp. SGAir0095 TaxID=2070463 RepID=UPI00143CDC32|nr:methyl-accepting chemotaxis protein [Lysinibacillus sp. SGAir0095]